MSHNLKLRSVTHKSTSRHKKIISTTYKNAPQHKKSHGTKDFCYIYIYYIFKHTCDVLESLKSALTLSNKFLDLQSVLNDFVIIKGI